MDFRQRLRICAGRRPTVSPPKERFSLKKTENVRSEKEKRNIFIRLNQDQERGEREREKEEREKERDSDRETCLT